MVPHSFVFLSRLLFAPKTRRRLLGGLAALPLLGGFGLEWGEEITARKRHRAAGLRAEGKGKGKKRKKRCRPKNRAQVCAGRCGVVRNRKTCKRRVNCGPPTAWVNQTTFGGTFGSAPNQFINPDAVALSADALTAWVTDSPNDRVAVWTRPSTSSSAWTSQTTFGDEGTNADQFQSPNGVAVSANGLTVWVTDRENHRVSVWTRPNLNSTSWSSQTTFGGIGTAPHQFDSPAGIARSEDELTVWVADSGNDRISVWTRPSASSTAWDIQTTFGTASPGVGQLLSPNAVAIAADGLLALVEENGRTHVSVWTRPEASSVTWSPQATFGGADAGGNQLVNPAGVAVSADGLTAWVTDYGSSQVSAWTRPDRGSAVWSRQTTFGSDGDGSGQFRGPTGVTVSADGLTLLVVDTASYRISVWAGTCPA